MILGEPVKMEPPILSLDTDMRVTPPKGNQKFVESKIIISPADEESIKAGNMTKAQETALMGKILAQIETNKLREAQRQESESIGNISLQPISDDELDTYCNSSLDESPKFGDKDERITIKDEPAVGDRDLRMDTHTDSAIVPPPVPPQFSFGQRGPAPAMAQDGPKQRRGRWDPPYPMPRPAVIEPWVRPPWRLMGPGRFPPPPPMLPKNFQIGEHFFI